MQFLKTTQLNSYHKHSSQRVVLVLAYLLTTVGYMTLTLSLPLLPYVSVGLEISHAMLQRGLALLFFMFSLSAIGLSVVSDYYGPRAVLKYAQLVSIMGLVVMGLSHTYRVFELGCFCVGAGTGCYSAIARTLISRFSADDIAMRKGFANISLLLVCAPFLAASLVLIFERFSWHLVYLIMALIESILFLYALWALPKTALAGQTRHIASAVYGLFACICQRHYLMNMLSLAMLFALYMQVFSANLSLIFLVHLQASEHVYFLVSLGMTASYIAGVLVFRLWAHNWPKLPVRIGSLLFLCVGLGLVWGHIYDVCSVLLGIFVCAFALGVTVPLTTSDGMRVIRTNFGAAAALYTFSFTCMAGILSYLQGRLPFDAIHFVIVALSFAIVYLSVLIAIFWAQHRSGS